MTSQSHIHTQTRVQQRNTYIEFSCTKHNNLTLNPDKTTCTPDLAEYMSNRNLKVNNTTLHMATHPKVIGLTLDPLTHSTPIHNFSVQAHKRSGGHLFVLSWAGHDGLLWEVLYGVWYVPFVVEVCVEYCGVHVFHVCPGFCCMLFVSYVCVLSSGVL